MENSKHQSFLGGPLSNYVESGTVEPAYGRFSRRTRAAVIDWIIIMPTDGNISFVKAVARVIIKGVLGIYSFNHNGNDVPSSSSARFTDAVNRADSRSLQGQPTSLRARTHGTIESSYALSLEAYPGYHSLTSGRLGCRAPRRLPHQAGWPFIQLIQRIFTGGRCSPSENHFHIVHHPG
jgi:hypothetical protein